MKKKNKKFELILDDKKKNNSLNKPQLPTAQDIKNTVEKYQALDKKSVALRDPLQSYLQDIKNYPILSKAEEKKLAIYYKETNDPEAAQKLVRSNLRFVVKVAAEYSKYGSKLIDLIQEGNIGLMHAIKEYNPYKDVKLISYAVWWIRGYIQDYLMKQHSLVKIGTTKNQKKLFYRLKKEKAELEKRGLIATPLLLSQKIGVPESDVISMDQRLSGRDVSLDKPIDDEGTTRLGDFQSYNPEEEIINILGEIKERAILEKALKNLELNINDKEKTIIQERLLAEEPKTLKQIGDEWGVSREAVRQMEGRVLKKIKKSVDAIISKN